MQRAIDKLLLICQINCDSQRYFSLNSVFKWKHFYASRRAQLQKQQHMYWMQDVPSRPPERNIDSESISTHRRDSPKVTLFLFFFGGGGGEGDNLHKFLNLNTWLLCPSKSPSILSLHHVVLQKFQESQQVCTRPFFWPLNGSTENIKK